MDENTELTVGIPIWYLNLPERRSANIVKNGGGGKQPAPRRIWQATRPDQTSLRGAASVSQIVPLPVG